MCLFLFCLFFPARRVCLPAGWIHTLPEVDQRWISKACSGGQRRGILSWSLAGWTKLWWYPPQVPLKTSNSPSLENYFGHPLLLWMPRKTVASEADLSTSRLSERPSDLSWLASKDQAGGCQWVRCTLWHLSTWPAEDVRGRSSAGAMTSSPARHWPQGPVPLHSYIKTCM